MHIYVCSICALPPPILREACIYAPFAIESSLKTMASYMLCAVVCVVAYLGLARTSMLIEHKPRATGLGVKV